MKIEISVGEVIDKYNVLEIKLKKITDKKKLSKISAEILLLEDDCKDIINANTYYYNILTYINEKIWDLTNKIKTINYTTAAHSEICAEFSQTSYEINEYNQKRYRLINIFNGLCNSQLKEYNNGDLNTVYLNIHTNCTIYKKLAEIYYLCIDYDLVFISDEFFNTVKKNINAPNICQVKVEENYIYTKEICLHEYSLSAELITVFENGLNKEKVLDEIIQANDTIEVLQYNLKEATTSRENSESYSKILETRVNELEIRVNELETHECELQTQLQTIETYKTELETRATELQTSVAEFETLARDFESRAVNLQNRVNELNELQKNYQNRIKFLEDELSEYKK